MTDQGDCLTHHANVMRDLALVIAAKLDEGWNLHALTALASDMARSSATVDPDCVNDVVLVAHGLLSGVAAPAADLRSIWGAHAFDVTAIWTSEAIGRAGAPPEPR